ncbi:hypothetical protein [Pseudoruegeria sp. HB172150]|uniref:hypothetical protein n=1 Tax=Pseudoruegeria sp. HB172150 TaxID=2721164 RepID=UPI001552EE50|nr:hypothetical protein [Pseudoruegeria sp. HB172150]
MDEDETQIEFLYEYRISKSQFDQLKDHEKVLVAMSCFAITEINVFSRVYIFASPPEIGAEVIDRLNFIQRFIVLRTWSAKIFEFFSFIEKIVPKSDWGAEFRELISSAQEEFSRIRSQDKYSVVRLIRHEVTNHYSYDAAMKNMKHVADGAEIAFHLHTMDGNCWYPLGEEVMFSGRLNRHTSNRATVEERLNISSEWMEWNLEATRAVRDFHGNVLTELILKKFPDKKAQKKMYWLPQSHVAAISSTYVPIVARKEIKE